jgi:hypothetical protein
MGLLDWIKDERNRRHGGSSPEDISTRCTFSYEKQNSQAGKEAVSEAKSAAAKTPPKRERAKGHDISF